MIHISQVWPEWLGPSLAHHFDAEREFGCVSSS